jgi:putative hydrolase of the HAD superfamily
MPTRAVLIDLFDTVARTEWEPVRRGLSDRLGVEPDMLSQALSATRRARSVGAYVDAAEEWQAILAWLGVDAPVEVARDMASLEYELLADGVTLYDDSLPAVADLRGRGIATALVSNCSHSARPVVERLGLDQAFDAVLLSFEVGSRKPQPAIYEAALTAVRADAADALFVDDQTEYCDGARSLGIDTRLIVRPQADPVEGFAASANGHAVIVDLNALREL